MAQVILSGSNSGKEAEDMAKMESVFKEEIVRLARHTMRGSLAKQGIELRRLKQRLRQLDNVGDFEPEGNGRKNERDDVGGKNDGIGSQESVNGPNSDPNHKKNIHQKRDPVGLAGADGFESLRKG